MIQTQFQWYWESVYRIDQEPLASMNVDDELLEYLSASSTANQEFGVYPGKYADILEVNDNRQQNEPPNGASCTERKI